MAQLSAPFPYYGGKARIAESVWRELGDVTVYAEPFAGSLAVLLAWAFVRGPEGTIDSMRRGEEAYERRNDANGALRAWHREKHVRPGMVLACDDGAFCEPPRGTVKGFTIAGPVEVPLAKVIDGHVTMTRSIRPSRRHVETMQVLSESDELELVPDA